MNFSHHGAKILEAGSVCFRLWAPSAKTVALMLEETMVFPMHKQENGWFELVSRNAAKGSRYRFQIDDKLSVPDPASRFQPDDVEGMSEVVDSAFDWKYKEWKGRPWEETVIYELHVGTFTPEGTFAGVESKLDHLAALGITAIELMPVSDFSGKRNWGYDGVLPYAPDSSYGRPEDLKRLIDSAHERGIMVFLDVVYNHFGPSGNYLHAYAKDFFTERHPTPWGAGINFDDNGNEAVRSFFIDNALYWLNEFRFDGLRFDAVHTIKDDSAKHFLHELAETIRLQAGQDRHVHLILENERNQSSILQNGLFSAQWNDDFHHAVHVLLTGQTTGYYEDYAQDISQKLARSLTEGFVYQGEVSPHSGKNRGEISKHLSPLAFVNHIQNHDQIGNRAMGDRLSTLVDTPKLHLAMSMLLLSPYIPMLFMGEEWASKTPFQFFCNFEGELADAVRNGRRKEFAAFPEFADEKQREKIPDPTAESTFHNSKLDWNAQDKNYLAFTRDLLAIRHKEIVPLLKSGWLKNTHHWHSDTFLEVQWHFKESILTMAINLSDTQIDITLKVKTIYGDANTLQAWSGAWAIC